MAGYYVEQVMDYLRAKYHSAHGKFDLYYLFIERGCTLLAKDGLLGFIVPNKLFHTKAASNLRGFLANSHWIRSI